MRRYKFLQSAGIVTVFGALALLFFCNFSTDAFAKPEQKPAEPKIKVTPREDITWGTDSNNSPSSNDRNNMNVQTNNREIDNGNNFNQPIIVAPEIRPPHSGTYPSHNPQQRPVQRPHPTKPKPTPY